MPGTVGHVKGSITPRIWTPPLITGPPGPCFCRCALTDATSYGFKVIDFAREQLKLPLDPWEEWFVIHAGELLADGRPRFRKLLLLVARQNGKTHLLVVLTLFWMYVDQVSMVLGTSTKLDYAGMSWRKAIKIARKVKALKAQISHRDAIRKANGEQDLWRATAEEREEDEGSHYKIAASNDEGGRSLTIDRLVMDELRQHFDYSAHDACVPATNAVWDAQIVAMSNAGSIRSVVLNEWRADAIVFIETGEGNPREGLFEYSAPEDADPRDIEALRQANPNLGIRLDPEELLAQGHAAVRRGGEKLSGFKTEIMCITVKTMNPAINPDGWKAGAIPGTMDGIRDKISLCFDVSPDNEHVTLVAAAPETFRLDKEDGSSEERSRIRVEVIEAWDGPGAVRRFAAALPAIVAKVKPRSLRWFPGGPAAVAAADVKAAVAATVEKGETNPFENVVVEEIKSETTTVCMALAELVGVRAVVHSDDELLNAHVGGAEKLTVGEHWRFVRKGAAHCDGAYAVAGAVDGARNLPPAVAKKPRSKVF